MSTTVSLRRLKLKARPINKVENTEAEMTVSESLRKALKPSNARHLYQTTGELANVDRERDDRGRFVADADSGAFRTALKAALKPKAPVVVEIERQVRAAVAATGIADKIEALGNDLAKLEGKR